MTGPIRGESIVCAALEHRYTVDGEQVVALDRVDLQIPAGSSTAIIGPSGSGKSTLIGILAGLQRPTGGSVHIGETDLTALGERELLRVRATRLAIVAQNPYRNVIPYGTAIQNLVFAQRAPRAYGTAQLPDPAELLAELRLEHVAHTRCDRISGGERQRLALAGALATAPTVLIADEPTSQLDAWNRRAVTRLLVDGARARGITTVIVTHDQDVADHVDSTVLIDDGRVAGGRE